MTMTMPAAAAFIRPRAFSMLSFFSEIGSQFVSRDADDLRRCLFGKRRESIRDLRLQLTEPSQYSVKLPGAKTRCIRHRIVPRGVMR
jgi:hypothetical protein